MLTQSSDDYIHLTKLEYMPPFSRTSEFIRVEPGLSERAPAVFSSSIGRSRNIEGGVNLTYEVGESEVRFDSEGNHL